ncbi:unnamed protein product [Urochloa decumbens]|uniref:Uncharacterized protein n=1 Tax=Urochloa decumbens TaxID=240449 RepID=A0ABC9BMC1_9POAL
MSSVMLPWAIYTLDSIAQPICELSFPGSMDAASSPDETIVPIPPLPQEIMPERGAFRERLCNTNERLESRILMIQTRIHRFPHRLRGIGGEHKSYIVPSVVAIGPYHHGQPHLQEMEEVKQAAAYRLLQGLGCTVEEVYQKILSVASDARRCYDDALPLVEGSRLSDAEFADMLFVDGCFLVWYLTSNHFDDPLLQWCNQSSGPSLTKDIFLLENQIPWLVLDALMELTKKDVRQFVKEKGAFVLSPTTENNRWWMQWGCIRNRHTDESREGTGAANDMEHYKQPPHLLALLRSVLICNMPKEKRESQLRRINIFPSLSIGAIELVQSGVKLTASASTAMSGGFADMKCQKKKPFFFGELSLSPLFLNDAGVSWLVNMAALESVEKASPARGDVDGYVVSSYLSMLAMLMDREEDVHELRSSGVLNSIFSNAQTLAFFKCLGQHLCPGYNYFNTLDEIDGYMRERPLRIAVHRFVYNNKKTIAAFMSFIGVLATILKALYSLKKP